jgi:hypothetical protein
MSAASDSSLISFALLLVELVLLVVTVYLLEVNRREQRGRDKLISHISSATDVVTRQEYFLTVLDSIQHSKKDLCGSVTGSPPSPGEEDVIGQVTDALAHAAARKVRVRYLLPHSVDRLNIAQRYTSAGAEVKFNQAVLVGDARFMVVDDREVVIGVPGSKGQDEPTKKGHVIPSESVAALFKAKFEELWNSPDARTYAGYLGELVRKARESNPAISDELIASNLKIEVGEVAKALARS